MASKRKSINWKGVCLDYLIKRDDLFCGLCNKKIEESSLTLDIDHIIPVADGGPDDLDNLRIVHNACHRLRSRIEQTTGNNITNFFERNGFKVGTDMSFTKHPIADLTYIIKEHDIIKKFTMIGEIRVLATLSHIHTENNISLSKACDLIGITLDRVRYLVQKHKFPNKVSQWPMIQESFFKTACEKHTL